jgi:mono/diheme cytochrome c family protein
MKRRNGGAWRSTIVVLVFLASCTSGTGAGSAKPDNTASPAKTFALPRQHDSGLSREARLGRGLYEYYCAFCHGKKGDADGFNAYNLRTPPTRHSDPILMGTLSDTQIQRIIKEGGGALGRSPQMPPWGGVLSDREIVDVTAFIRTLAVPVKTPKE